MIPYQCTQVEADLLRDIKDLGFGELLDLELPETNEKPTVLISLEEPQKKLVNAIRDGHRFFTVLVVHNGMPSYGEFPTETKCLKHRCRKRLKFS